MRQRIIVILVIIIAVVLILTLARGKPEPKKKVAKQTTSSTTKPKEELAKPTAKPTPVGKEEKKEVAKTTTAPSLVKEGEEGWGEDPFVRDFSFLTEIKDLRLTAITISESKSYALINDMILGVGDEIAGKKVVAIEKDKVVVEKGGRKFEVYLGQ